MKDAPRRAVLLLALLAAGAAAYFAPEPPQTVKPTKVATPGSSPIPIADTRSVSSAQTTVDIQVQAIRPREDMSRRGRPDELFQVRVTKAAPSASVPLASPHQPTPPAEPPPVALKVIGQYAEEDRIGLFVEYKEENLLAYVGDTIGGLYRIEAIQENRVTLRYLPLDLQQFVDLSQAGGK